jgi:hypothetical protein
MSSNCKAKAPVHQSFGSLRPVRLVLAPETRSRSVRALNRPLAREATEHGDDGTNDVIVSEVIRTNELQAWFVGEHLVGNERGLR